jgi:N utilization substance protein A
MNQEVIEALKQLEREKGIEFEVLVQALEEALARAYLKLPGAAASARVVIDRKTGEMRLFAQEVDEEGNVLREWEEKRSDFGRIAAQTAKQTIVQKIRDAEREQTYEEFAGKEGDIVTGIVKQYDARYALVDLGKVEGLLPHSEQIPGERLEHGLRLKLYVVDVKRTLRGPQIILSRSHPGLVRRLFEQEVPEIAEGVVEIKAIAREAGHRTKMAVWSREPAVDPIGACVGPKGARVRAVVAELKGEKIDIVEWSEDPAVLVANALSPAKVKEVRINEEEKLAVAIVPDYQLSLAIGREGQNARLASRLTGWRIDIRAEGQEQPGKAAATG